MGETSGSGNDVSGFIGGAAECVNGEIGDEKTTGQEPDSVQGIGNGAGAQSAPDCVDRPDEGNQYYDTPECLRIGGEPEQGVEIQHVEHAAGAGIKNDRQEDDRVCGKEDDVADQFRLSVEPLFKVFRNGCDSCAQKFRQEEKSHQNQCDDRHDLPCHHGKPVCERVAVEPDHLLE